MKMSKMFLFLFFQRGDECSSTGCGHFVRGRLGYYGTGSLGHHRTSS